MEINSQIQIQQNKPTFGAKMIKPNQLNRVPYASVPLALGALAILGLAQLSIDKEKNIKKLPSVEIFTQTLKEMKEDGKDTSRFTEENIEKLSELYKKDPELVHKLVYLKSNDGKIIFTNEYDLIKSIKSYEKHPEFSEYVIDEIKNSNFSLGAILSLYLKAESENSDLLYRLYNRRNDKTPLIPGYYADYHVDAYEKFPEFCEELLEAKNIQGRYVHGTNEIQTICKAYEQDPTLTKEIINITDDCGNKPQSPFVEKILSFEPEKRDFYIKLLKSDISYYRIEEIYILKEKNPELINKLTSSENAKGSCPFDATVIKDIFEIDGETEENKKRKQNYAINFIIRGIDSFNAMKLAKREDANIIQDLLEKGVSLEKIKRVIKYKTAAEFAQEVVIPRTALSEFFKDPNYMNKIRENSAGKYQKELIRLFEPDKIPYKLYSKLVNSDLTVEDFLASLKKISKSSFKLAYDTPNQYLPDLNSNLSTSVNGHYPKLNQYELEFERGKVIDFYINNFAILSKLLKYVDNDTVNHMMDKRFRIFSNELELFNKIPKEKLELMNKLLQCKSEKTDKPLTVKEKLQICEIVKIFNIGNIDCQHLKNAMDKGIVNIDKLKNIILIEILTRSNVNITEINHNDLTFNKEYLHLLLTSSARDLETEEECENYKSGIIEILIDTIKYPENLKLQKESILEILNNIDTDDKHSKEILELSNKIIYMLDNIKEYSIEELINICLEYNYLLNDFYSANNEIYSLINGTFSKDFKAFIHNPKNKYGKANLKTKEIFKEKGLNHNEWINPNLKKNEFEISGKKMSIKLWDRNPLEDLFMGNKTTCCTAIGRANGGSTPVYIMGECWNVVQLCDENGNLVGMSRIFIGENNGECSVMMDNIELNNNFTKDISDDEKTKIRQEFFKYIHQFAEKVIGKKDAKVYFYRGDTHVKTSDLSPIDINIEFVGQNPTPLIYINSAGMKWLNPEEFSKKPTNWFEVPKQ